MSRVFRDPSLLTRAQLFEHLKAFDVDAPSNSKKDALVELYKQHLSPRAGTPVKSSMADLSDQEEGEVMNGSAKKVTSSADGNLDSMTNDQLREKLIELGHARVPVTDATRSVYIRKLQKLLSDGDSNDSKPKLFSDSEEDDHSSTGSRRQTPSKRRTPSLVKEDTPTKLTPRSSRTRPTASVATSTQPGIDGHRDGSAEAASIPSHIPRYRDSPVPSQPRHRDSPLPSQPKHRESPVPSLLKHRESPVPSQPKHRESPMSSQSRRSLAYLSGDSALRKRTLVAHENGANGTNGANGDHSSGDDESDEDGPTSTRSMDMEETSKRTVVTSSESHSSKSSLENEKRPLPSYAAKSIVAQASAPTETKRGWLSAPRLMAVVVVAAMIVLFYWIGSYLDKSPTPPKIGTK